MKITAVGIWIVVILFCLTNAKAQNTPEQFDLILSGGRVLDPANSHDGIFDVGIAEGKIARVAAHRTGGREVDRPRASRDRRARRVIKMHVGIDGPSNRKSKSYRRKIRQRAERSRLRHRVSILTHVGLAEKRGRVLGSCD